MFDQTIKTDPFVPRAMSRNLHQSKHNNVAVNDSAQPNLGIERQAVRGFAKKIIRRASGQANIEIYQQLLAEVEPALIDAVLEQTNYNQSKACIILGLNRGTLREKITKYGLRKNR